MSVQHQKFLSRLERSRASVLAVADWLRLRGQEARVPDLQFAPSASVAESFVDSGDILLRGGRVEVKQIRRNFTSASDWPFREYFISNEAAVNRARGVLAYITVSGDYAAIAVVKPAESRKDWYVKETLASNTGNRERFVACSLRHVAFYALGPMFAHYCRCGKWGSYGVRGIWFCRDHRPASAS